MEALCKLPYSLLACLEKQFHRVFKHLARMSTPDCFAVVFQFLHRCSIELPTSSWYRVAFRRNNVLEKTPNILFLGQITLCRCSPQASAQGWLNMKNEITQVIVIGVLLHCQACTSFHNLSGFVCYKAP